MKPLLALFFLILFCYQTAFSLTKGEFLTKTADLEAKALAFIEEIKFTHPNEARTLYTEVRQLQVLSSNLKQAQEYPVINQLELIMNAIEIKVIEQIQRIQGTTTTTPNVTYPTTITTLTPSTLTTIESTTTQPTTIIPINCRTESLNKLSALVKKLNNKIDRLSEQNNETEAIVLIAKVKQVLIWESQLDKLLKQADSIILLADNLDKTIENIY